MRRAGPVSSSPFRVFRVFSGQSTEHTEYTERKIFARPKSSDGLQRAEGSAASPQPKRERQEESHAKGRDAWNSDRRPSDGDVIFANPFLCALCVLCGLIPGSASGHFSAPIFLPFYPRGSRAPRFEPSRVNLCSLRSLRESFFGALATITRRHHWRRAQAAGRALRAGFCANRFSPALPSARTRRRAIRGGGRWSD